MATYSQLWQVLAKLYGVKEPVGKGPMRARLQKLQQEGIPEGSNVGKGKRVDYTMTQLFQIVFCLELLGLGMTPSIAYEMALAGWPNVSTALRRSKKYREKLKDMPEAEELFCISTKLSEPETLKFYCFLTSHARIFEELDDADWRKVSILNISTLIRDVEVAASEILGMDFLYFEESLTTK